MSLAGDVRQILTGTYKFAVVDLFGNVVPSPDSFVLESHDVVWSDVTVAMARKYKFTTSSHRPIGVSFTILHLRISTWANFNSPFVSSLKSHTVKIKGYHQCKSRSTSSPVMSVRCSTISSGPGVGCVGKQIGFTVSLNSMRFSVYISATSLCASPGL